ncbi:hypothetical protein ACC685_38715, partial [Rhizobium ruizarguesonis]
GTEKMARLAPRELVGIHVNVLATAPDDIAAALRPGGTKPAGLSADEEDAGDQLVAPDVVIDHTRGKANG